MRRTFVALALALALALAAGCSGGPGAKRFSGDPTSSAPGPSFDPPELPQEFDGLNLLEKVDRGECCSGAKYGHGDDNKVLLVLLPLMYDLPPQAALTKFTNGHKPASSASSDDAAFVCFDSGWSEWVEAEAVACDWADHSVVGVVISLAPTTPDDLLKTTMAAQRAVEASNA